MILGEMKCTTTFPLTLKTKDLIPCNYLVTFIEGHYWCKLYRNNIYHQMNREVEKKPKQIVQNI